MNTYDALSCAPLRLLPTRVSRTYTGGLLLEKLQGCENPKDSDTPEDWVGSSVEARFSPIHNEGLSSVYLPNGETALLKDVIHSAPEQFLGTAHVASYGENMAVLVKLIDSAERLSIQVHPDKEFAQKVFCSDFGKTEAWYILDKREQTEEPYILMGFKPGVTKEMWQTIFETQDIPAMENCLHKIALAPGDVYLIRGGVPHAIGPGCFLMEVQEPTDLTMRTEKITPNGKELSELFIHQGVGIEKMLDCFHYDARTLEQTLASCKITPKVIRAEAGGTETQLLGPNDTDKFAMNEITVTESLKCTADASFSSLIVLAGEGRIEWDGGAYDLRPSASLFLPFQLSTFTLRRSSTCAEPLKVARCFPPK